MVDPARITEEQSTQRRASVLGFAYVDTSQIEKHIYKNILTTAELYSLKVVPLMADEHHIIFGITTVTSQQTLNLLGRRFTDQRISFSIISETGFKEYLQLYDPPKKVEYHDISLTENDQTKMVKTVSDSLNQVKPDDMLAYLVQQAHELSASDIHLENQRENVRIRFRIDGVLHPVADLSHEKYRLLLSAIASAANVSTASSDAQTGHISRSYKLATGDDVTINIRAETVPTVFGTDAVLRLFNLKLEFFNLSNLGLDQTEMELVNQIIKNPTGLVLIVGPTGSGKTTTLYSMISSLNTPERKIITLEDPVEYNLPGVIQIPVAGDLNSQNFAERLRAVLRLDPDVVMVGEIRDQDTAKTALQGALTGHLVLSTFHADNAAAALTRLIDMAGANPLLNSAIRLIMAQRLVRRLDDQIKQPYHPDEALKSKIRDLLADLPAQYQKPDLDNITLFKPGKSPTNLFGYSGQLALREQMAMSPGVQTILRLPPSQITSEQLQKQAVQEGMKTMLHDGLLKALAGQTTIEEVFRVVSVAS
jgi:type II secretory ATPase GspE/PulE/Tfp pilus assembly ATPase PilB-like protein